MELQGACPEIKCRASILLMVVHSARLRECGDGYLMPAHLLLLC